MPLPAVSSRAEPGTKQAFDTYLSTRGEKEGRKTQSERHGLNTDAGGGRGEKGCSQSR